jgi:hypothetical protein
MSQICPTAVEHIFDGRHTKREKLIGRREELIWEMRGVNLEVAVGKVVTGISRADEE